MGQNHTLEDDCLESPGQGESAEDCSERRGLECGSCLQMEVE